MIYGSFPVYSMHFQVAILIIRMLKLCLWGDCLGNPHWKAQTLDAAKRISLCIVLTCLSDSHSKRTSSWEELWCVPFNILVWQTSSSSSSLSS